MVFLKQIIKLPFLRNRYIKYANRYGITFSTTKNERGIKIVLITKEKADAIHKIYYECDYPKYKDLKIPIDDAKEYFTNK